MSTNAIFFYVATFCASLMTGLCVWALGQRLYECAAWDAGIAVWCFCCALSILAEQVKP